MKKFLISWFKRLSKPDISKIGSRLFWKLASKDSISAIADDARKIGVNAIGIGLVGVVVNNDTIPRATALLVLVSGVIIWVFGWFLTCSNSQHDKE